VAEPAAGPGLPGGVHRRDQRQDPRRQRRQPIYIALGVTVDGTRDVLGLWAGEHGDGEGSKYWLRVLSEIKNRGTQDVCIVVCDGLKGLPTAIESVWPQAITQTCVIHLLRNSFRYASKRDCAAIAKDLKLVYTAASESAALDAFVAFSETWGERYPAIIKLWGTRGPSSSRSWHSTRKSAA
jgi:putative transposase